VLQDRLRRFDWLRPLPAHFLHVTVAALGLGVRRHDVPTLLEQGREALRGAGRFRLAFPRLNCFHEAVVAEVEGDGIHDAAERLRGDLDSFLPHLSLAYTTEPGDPEELRESLATLRATHLGEQEVREVLLCLVPASRATILEPWTVAGRATLD
jgi:2'-5' RNA ligase